MAYWTGQDPMRPNVTVIPPIVVVTHPFGPIEPEDLRTLAEHGYTERLWETDTSDAFVTRDAVASKIPRYGNPWLRQGRRG